MIGEKSDYDYNYKNEFQILKEDKEFEHQNILMSRPPLELTLVGMNTSNEKILSLDSTHVGAKIPDPKILTLPTELSK